MTAAHGRTIVDYARSLAAKPIKAVELLAPDIRSVHVKDANRPPKPGVWGDEVPLGQGQTNTKLFIQTLVVHLPHSIRSPE